MTQKLRALSQGTFEVEVTLHDWDFAGYPKMKEWNVSLNDPPFIRDVYLKSFGKKVIAARSVFPKTSLADAWKKLEKLGSTPMGDIIYSDPDLKRSEFQFTKRDRLYGRCSAFTSNQRSFLLTEFFLPDFYEVIRC